MKRIFFLTMMMTLTAAASQQAVPEKPNVVIIHVDDMGWRDAGSMGSPVYETPNIDRLAKSGTLFTSAYASANICTPSRACMLTGSQPSRHGVYTVVKNRGKKEHWVVTPKKNNQFLPKEYPTIATELSKAGIANGSVGKWHVSAKVPAHGFAEGKWGGYLGLPINYFAPFKLGFLPKDAPDGAYLPTYIREAGVEFLENHQKEKFFLYFSTYVPHDEIKNEGEDSEFSGMFRLAAPEKVVSRYKAKIKAMEAEGKDLQGHTNAVYAAMIEETDRSVGAIVDKLDELKLRENTLVLFISDNGGLSKYTSQRPLRGQKCTLYEGGIRVPMIASMPGYVEAGKISDEPVSGIDFYPTICRLMDVKPTDPKLVDGEDLTDLLFAGTSLGERNLFWNFPVYNRPQDVSRSPRSVMRRGDWKIHHRYEDGGYELYNLKEDIGEAKDLARTHPKDLERMHRELEACYERFGAVKTLPANPEYDAPSAKAEQAKVEAEVQPPPVSTEEAYRKMLQASKDVAKKDSRPNVIFILADDLGYGDLSIMGQKKLQTPNIDRLGTEGIIFSDHYSGNTVCSPSRANLMTGQHPGHVACRSNGTQMTLKHLDPAMVTLPRLFKNAGYATGAFGKWGLGTTSDTGRANPMTHGFDVFSGWKSQVIAHTYYPSSIVRNGKEVPLAKGTFIHDLIMDDARSFIKENATAGKPFFAYIPTAVPHAAMHAPKQLHDKWRKVFPQFDNKIGKYRAGGEICPPVTNPIAGFAAMMENLDNEVGSVMNLLKELGVDDNTLVIFASDNGPHHEGGHDPVFWDSNGPLRGIKRDYYEGGIRSPFLARWPGKIKSGGKSNHISAFWDMLPTMAALTGQPVPQQTDGISILPTLLGQTEKQEAHDYLYWEDSTIKGGIKKTAIRQGNWKGVRKYGKGKKAVMELFDLSKDLGEENNIATEHTDIVKRLEQFMAEAHRPAGVPSRKEENK